MASRERLYRTEAVVLRRHDLGEADRLITLFAPGRGRIRAVAKGVRRPGSKKAGHLEPFARSRLMVARGRELDIITQAELIQEYPSLRGDLMRLGLAASVVELMDRFGIEEAESQALYLLLIDTLEHLDRDADPENALRYFQIRLLDLVGYRPELQRCVNCAKEAKPEDQFFSAARGGVLCRECGPTRGEARPITLRALKVMRHYQRHGYQVATQPQISQPVSLELESIMESYLSHLLERELHVPTFVRQVRRLGVDP